MRQLIDYSNSTGIGSTLGLVKLNDGIYPATDAVNEFNYFSIAGMIYSDKNIPIANKFQQLKFFETDNYYKLKIGIIPKKIGIYYLGVSDGISNGRTKSRSCEKVSFNITFLNTNQHLNYFSKWNPNGTLGMYEMQRAYFFKVY